LNVTIRPLVADDAAALRALRLEAMQVAASAFSSSYEEEAARPPEWFSAVAAGSENDVIFGAFDTITLVGMVGVRRQHEGQGAPQRSAGRSLRATVVSPPEHRMPSAGMRDRARV
jgi:hypothetical protein